VAGGIEYDDLKGLGIDGRAAREVREEAGFQVRPEDAVALGEATVSSPAYGMEKIHYRAVRVDPEQAVSRTGRSSSGGGGRFPVLRARQGHRLVPFGRDPGQQD